MRGRLLVAYSNAWNFVSAIADYLDAISQYSHWDVSYVHVSHDAEIGFDLNEFDAIFQNHCARLDIDGFVSGDYLNKLRNFRGVKLIAVQDEYLRTYRRKAAISEFGFHVVLTCVSGRLADQMYPRAAFPVTQFINVLTGYIPEHLAERGHRIKPLRERPIAIGYRGSTISANYGRLGFLKVEIGRRMREACEARGIPHDIEWGNEKRIYGEAWYEFLASCRATLGSESGSNVFDFDGSIERTYNRLCVERGGPVPYEEFRAHTDPIEALYDQAQISPRIFEAAVLRTPLILFPGRYSGLIEPDEHYIELKENFSNVEEVLARLDDLEALEAMADRAYSRLVGSGEYSYRRFVGFVDELLAKTAARLSVPLRGPREVGEAIEVGADLAALASLEERPTKKPRHFIFYDYKRIVRECEYHKQVNQNYAAEIAAFKARDARFIDTSRLSHAFSGTAIRLGDVSQTHYRSPGPPILTFVQRLLLHVPPKCRAWVPAFVRMEVKRPILPAPHNISWQRRLLWRVPPWAALLLPPFLKSAIKRSLIR